MVSDEQLYRWLLRDERWLCSRCTAGETGAIVAVLLAIVLALLGLCIGFSYIRHASEVTQPGRHRIRVFVLEHGVRFAVRARIFLTMIAIIDGAGKHVGNYPIIFDGCLRIISYLYYWLLDVTVLLPWIDCLLPSYHAVFLAKALIPMVIFVLLMAVSVSFKFFRAAEYFATTCHAAAFILLIIVYPAVSATTFAMFDCVQVVDGSRFLRADPHIECESAEHGSMEGVALIMIFVWPAGAPMVLSLVVYMSKWAEVLKAETPLFSIDCCPLLRLDGLTKKESYAAVQEARMRDIGLPARVLTAGYKARFRYWECGFEYLRKVTVVGALVFFGPGTPTQLAAASMIALLSWQLVAVVRPHVWLGDQVLAQLSCALPFALFFLQFVFGTLLGDDGALATNHACDALLTIMLLLTVAAVFAPDTIYLRLCRCCKPGASADTGGARAIKTAQVHV
jgi:hypothetical protein